jgi:hypothetical protein
MPSDVRENAMKALSSLRRNDVIKGTALVAVVVFPLIAHAQLGRSSAALTASLDAAPAAVAAVETVATKRDPCADQHWPFFSTECLRQSRATLEPRLISMNEAWPNSTTGEAPKDVRTADIVRDKAPSARSKKPVKPRIASHRRERRTPSVYYAVNSQPDHMSMPGW